MPRAGHRGGKVVDCVDRLIGAIARNRELSGLNLNDLDMKRLLADFLLFSVPVSAENIVQKPFTEKHAELNSVILTRS